MIIIISSSNSSSSSSSNNSSSSSSMMIVLYNPLDHIKDDVKNANTLVSISRRPLQAYTYIYIYIYIIDSTRSLY